MRPAPLATELELQFGVPVFLQELVLALELEEAHADIDPVTGPSNPIRTPSPSAIGRSAARHGRELQQQGLTVAQVVHDYGDLCQAVTELAVELRAPITNEEFRTLNRCMDNAMADAVTAFLRARESVVVHEADAAGTERRGNFAHEMRNLLNSATLAVAVIKAGKVGMGGATGQVLDRSLAGLGDLIDRSIADVRSFNALQRPSELVDLAEFIGQVQGAAVMEARALGAELSVPPVAAGVAIDVDRRVLSSALSNLLQNAFKFSRRGATISLKAGLVNDRVLIEVEDECGGLKMSATAALFRPFAQRADDRSGMGLGLPIAQRAVGACGGQLRVRDLPGKGCVFSIDLPRAG